MSQEKKNDKSFSRILLRLSRECHRRLVNEAVALKLSLNAHCLDLLGARRDYRRPAGIGSGRRSPLIVALGETAEDQPMMFCPLHRKPVLAGSGGKCPTCESLGLQVHVCELDKINRVIDTLQEQGHTVNFHRSYAVIVEEKPKEEGACPET